MIPGLALASLFIFALPAYASATPSTVTLHDVAATFPVTSTTCPDGSIIPGGTLAVIFNGVAHSSTDANGGIHFTTTLEASLTLSASTNGIDYAGHYTAWLGGNAHFTSTGATEFGFTFSAHATGTDGGRIDFHMDSQFTVTPSGTVTVDISNFRC